MIIPTIYKHSNLFISQRKRYIGTYKDFAKYFDKMYAKQKTSTLH